MVSEGTIAVGALSDFRQVRCCLTKSGEGIAENPFGTPSGRQAEPDLLKHNEV
jgi:hypothetical protein